MAPTHKVAAAAGGGTLATIVVLAFAQLGTELDPAVAAAIATVAAFVAGYLKR